MLLLGSKWPYERLYIIYNCLCGRSLSLLPAAHSLFAQWDVLMANYYFLGCTKYTVSWWTSICLFVNWSQGNNQERAFLRSCKNIQKIFLQPDLIPEFTTPKYVFFSLMGYSYFQIKFISLEYTITLWLRGSILWETPSPKIQWMKGQRWDEQSCAAVPCTAGKKWCERA